MDGLLEVDNVLELLQASGDVRGCNEGPPDTDEQPELGGIEKLGSDVFREG